MKKNTRNIIIVLILLLFVVFFAYLRGYFLNTEKEYIVDVYGVEQEDDSGFSFFSGDLYYEEERDMYMGNKIILNLSPGERFDGKLAISNSEPMMYGYDITLDELSYAEGISSILPEVDLLGNNEIFVAPGDIEYFEYSVEVSEEVKLGSYESTFRAKWVPSKTVSQKTEDGQGSVVFSYAIAVPLKIMVSSLSDENEFFDVERKISDYSLTQTFVRGGGIFAVFLGVASVVFLVLSFALKSKKK